VELVFCFSYITEWRPVGYNEGDISITIGLGCFVCCPIMSFIFDE